MHYYITHFKIHKFVTIKINVLCLFLLKNIRKESTRLILNKQSMRGRNDTAILGRES